MSQLIHIADRVLNRPLLITRDKAQVIMSVLGGRIGLGPETLGPATPEASRFEGDSIVRDDNGRAVKQKPYNVSNGVAIITITGSLVNRGAWVGASSGLTSYEGIQHQIKSAMKDDAVKSVILDMHSPGGEAVGAFETAALVRELSAQKRTVAVINGMAASAGYAIPSGASEIVTTETGVGGSIGVVLLHADYSRALANEGISPTLIFAGAHKVDGNPFEALSSDVKADLQDEVNAFYDLFLKTVAKGRGNRLTAAQARKTEARTFIGQAAVDAGIADRVGSFESVLADLTRASGRSTSQPRRTSMSENTGAPAANEDAGIPKATHDAAVKQARADGKAEGIAEGTKTGAEAERTRLAAIIGAEGIKGNAARLSAALELASESPEMSAEKVVSFAAKNIAESGPSAALADRAAQPDSLARAGNHVQQSKANSWADFRAKRGR
ncbi:MAG: S49 family peptidase [Mesorhizobium sp.]|uniref:S49 family peptidase n=1 Tax=Mesorhizobium sp. TaxID=1871066 RepID=UPI000FE4E960|nr:S49 family peptidase [Mesorhizobium sp.]RWF44288.1 MAG: S49 family peptidase [Mesorhizobium sp.]